MMGMKCRELQREPSILKHGYHNTEAESMRPTHALLYHTESQDLTMGPNATVILKQ